MMQILHFYPKNELLRRHIQYFYISNYEEKFVKKNFVMYPTIFNNVAIQDNFVATLSNNQLTFREYEPRKLNLNALNRFKKPLTAIVDGVTKVLSVVFKPGGINFFCDKPLSEIVPNIHSQFYEWDDKSAELNELLYCFDVERLGDKLEKILLSIYREYENEVLFDALELLHQDYVQFNVDELERTLQVNRRTLLRQFKKHIGVSVTDYRRILRFREAISLQPTNENLTRLAYETFFCDQSHFIKDFQKLAGATPKKVFNEAGYFEQTPFFLKVSPP